MNILSIVLWYISGFLFMMVINSIIANPKYINKPDEVASLPLMLWFAGGGLLNVLAVGLIYWIARVHYNENYIKY